MEANTELQRIQELKLYEMQIAKVRDWFLQEQKIKDSKKEIPILNVEELNFGYTSEKHNLVNVDFTVHRGEMISSVGKNGAGKSTLAKLLCGFEKVNTGTISHMGRDLVDDTTKERAQYIRYVMQNPNQMISKPLIYEEVALSLEIQKIPPDIIKERVHEALKTCGLYQFRNWPISALSYGQKKRVTIASILVQQPEILILDEPTAGQDLRHYTEFMEFLKELNKKGITVIMITHDMHLMLEYTSRCLVFSDGRLIADTTPSKLFADKELIARASLKETSLFELAEMCGIDPEAYIEKFIRFDRQVRDEWQQYFRISKEIR